MKTLPIHHADPRFECLARLNADNMEFAKAENLVWALYRFTCSTGTYPALLAFRGRGRKPVCNSWFKTEELRDQHLAKLIDNAKRHRLETAMRRKKSNAGHNFNEGDIVYNTWGWEQTNQDFYRVVATSKCYVKLQPVASTFVTINKMGMCGTVRPLPDEETDGAVIRCKAEGDYISFKYGSGSIWKGKPLHTTWYA